MTHTYFPFADEWDEDWSAWLREHGYKLIAELLAKLTLPPRQVKAIAIALGGGTPQQVAQMAKVHRGTLYRWCRHDPAFGQALARCMVAVRKSRETHATVMTHIAEIERHVRIMESERRRPGIGRAAAEIRKIPPE